MANNNSKKYYYRRRNKIHATINHKVNRKVNDILCSQSFIDKLKWLFGGDIKKV
jgi:hypothetical protein